MESLIKHYVIIGTKKEPDYMPLLDQQKFQVMYFPRILLAGDLVYYQDSFFKVASVTFVPISQSELEDNNKNLEILRTPVLVLSF